MRREEVELFQNMNGQLSVSFEHVSEPRFLVVGQGLFS